MRGRVRRGKVDRLQRTGPTEGAKQVDRRRPLLTLEDVMREPRSEQTRSEQTRSGQPRSGQPRSGQLLPRQWAAPPRSECFAGED